MLENTLIVCAVVVVSVIVGGALGYAKGLCEQEDSRVDRRQLRDPSDAVPQPAPMRIVSRRPDTTVIVRMVPDSTFGGK
jgi:hypothetical protein